MAVDLLDELEHLGELRLGSEMSIGMLTPFYEDM